MPLDPLTLLEGPRGRRLCLELLLDRHEGDERPAWEAVFWVSHALDPNPGTLITIGADDGYVQPVVTVEDAASLLAELAVPPLTESRLRRALAVSVDRAMYWQAPDGEDVLAARDELRPSLARVAQALAASPEAQWWGSGVARDDQWAVSWDGGATAQTDAAAELARWRDDVVAEEERARVERPIDPAANWTGTWWSRPPSGLARSARGLGAAGPAGLWFVEDGLGWESAVATPVLPVSTNVLEIDGADAWIALCRRHPLVVTASRRHDWFRVTGWTGEWVQPDWASVAHEVDGVHLTVAGYLEAATRLLEVGDGRASVIAGWNPDETFWFGDTRAGGASEEWTRIDDEWHPVPGREGGSSGDSV
ncbi:hypothetical protein [Microbacterium sp.]|uniref:hypothetical protein n=1 Tax=Microbacterium sp. TaxID=51671 RepID=UPI003F6FF6E4